MDSSINSFVLLATADSIKALLDLLYNHKLVKIISPQDFEHQHLKMATLTKYETVGRDHPKQ